MSTRFWHHTGVLQSWLRGTSHGVSRKYLPRYLDEFSFRFNHRGKEAAIGTKIFERVLTGPPFPYHRLQAELAG